MPQNQQNIISKTKLKHYNQFRSVITEALRWLQITTYTGKKIKVVKEAKERDHKLFDFIAIVIIKSERKKYP